MRSPRRRRRPRIARVGLVRRYTSGEAIALSRRLDRFLSRHGLEVVHDAESAPARGGRGGAPRTQIAGMVDLVITLGGDGTLLSVARHPAENVPVLGIDIGTLGFLTACGPDEYESVLDAALEGRAPIEKRRLLAVTVVDDGKPARRYRVVNDAVLGKSALSRIAGIRVEVDREMVLRYR